MTACGMTVLMYEEKAWLDETALDPEYVMQSAFRVKYSDDNIMTFKIEVRNKDACVCKLARQAI